MADVPKFEYTQLEELKIGALQCKKAGFYLKSGDAAIRINVVFVLVLFIASV